jgi:hypothetical protein
MSEIDTMIVKVLRDDVEKQCRSSVRRRAFLSSSKARFTLVEYLNITCLVNEVMCIVDARNTYGSECVNVLSISLMTREKTEG